MTFLQNLIERHSGAVLIVFALAALLCALAARDVRIDGTVDRLMLREDPLRPLDALAKQDFGNDEIIMVGFELGAPYTADDLRKLHRISERISALDDVRKVRDLATTEDVRGDEDTLDASPLVDLETLDADLAAIRERAQDHRLYDRLLVSPDGQTLGLLVYAESTRANDASLSRLSAQVFEVVEALAPPWRAHFAGYPVTAYEVNRIVRRDLALLTPLALVVMGGVLILYTRRASPLGLLIAQVLWVELAALAWLGLSDTPINVVISTLPTLLVATSGTYVIYAVGLLQASGADQHPALSLLRLIYRPALLSSSSTAIGFVSLSMIGMESAGDLGVALAVGIVASLLGTLLLIPALIQRFGLRLPPRTSPLLDRWSGVGVRLARRPGWVVAGAALVLAVAVPGAFGLRLHTDTLQYFDENNRVRTGAEFFQERLSSGFLLNVVIRSDSDDRAIDPDVLGFAEGLIAKIEALPHVDRTISMLDYFELMDAALRPGETPRRYPGSRAAASQYMLLYESGGDPEDYDRYIDFTRSALSVIVSVRGGSSVYLDAARQIEDWSRAAPADVDVQTLGTTFLYAKAMDDLTRGMVRGLAVASLAIFGVLVLGLGNLRLALLATIPNLIPIAVSAGVLGWLGVPVSMSTSLMGCIALGLAVDDTTHVVGHVSPQISLEKLYGLVGGPILLTTVALCVGFAVLFASEFATVSVLGGSVIVTLLLAYAADMLLLPSLLALAGYPRTQRERVAQLEGPAKRKEP